MQNKIYRFLHGPQDPAWSGTWPTSPNSFPTIFHLLTEFQTHRLSSLSWNTLTLFLAWFFPITFTHWWPKRPNSIKLLSDLNLLIFLLCLKPLTNLFFTEAFVISWLSWYWVFLVYPLILQIFHFSPWVEFLSSVQTSNVNFQSHQQKTTCRKTVWNKSPKCFPREVREYVICFHFTLYMFCFSLMRITSGFF